MPTYQQGDEFRLYLRRMLEALTIDLRASGYNEACNYVQAALSFITPDYQDTPLVENPHVENSYDSKGSNPLVEKDPPRGNPTTPHVETRPPRGHDPLVDNRFGHTMDKDENGYYMQSPQTPTQLVHRQEVHLSEETKVFLRGVFGDLRSAIHDLCNVTENR